MSDFTKIHKDEGRMIVKQRSASHLQFISTPLLSHITRYHMRPNSGFQLGRHVSIRGHFRFCRSTYHHYAVMRKKEIY